MLVQQEKKIGHLVNWQITDKQMKGTATFNQFFFFFVGGNQLKNDNASGESRWDLRFPETTEEKYTKNHNVTFNYL